MFFFYCISQLIIHVRFMASLTCSPVILFDFYHSPLPKPTNTLVIFNPMGTCQVTHYRKNELVYKVTVSPIDCTVMYLCLTQLLIVCVKAQYMYMYM